MWKHTVEARRADELPAALLRVRRRARRRLPLHAPVRALRRRPLLRLPVAPRRRAAPGDHTHVFRSLARPGLLAQIPEPLRRARSCTCEPHGLGPFDKAQHVRSARTFPRKNTVLIVCVRKCFGPSSGEARGGSRASSGSDVRLYRSSGRGGPASCVAGCAGPAPGHAAGAAAVMPGITPGTSRTQRPAVLTRGGFLDAGREPPRVARHPLFRAARAAGTTLSRKSARGLLERSEWSSPGIHRILAIVLPVKIGLAAGTTLSRKSARDRLLERSFERSSPGIHMILAIALPVKIGLCN